MVEKAQVERALDVDMAYCCVMKLKDADKISIGWEYFCKNEQVVLLTNGEKDVPKAAQIGSKLGSKVTTMGL